MLQALFCEADEKPKLAEAVRFELTVGITLHTLSKRAP